MINYLILNLIITFFAFLYLLFLKKMNLKTRFFYTFFLLLLFVITVTFRPLDSPDTLSYKLIFESSRDILRDVEHINLLSKYGTGDGSAEYGFIFFCALVNRLFPSYRVFFCILAMITSIIIPLCINKIFFKQNNFNSFSVIFVIYIISFGILYSGIAIRAGLGISLGLISLVYAKEKKILKCLFFVFIAFCIHRTAIVFTLANFVFLFSKRKETNILGHGFKRLILFEVFVIVVMMLLFHFGFKGITSELLSFIKLDSYLSYMSTNTKLGITKILICICIIALLFFVYEQKLKIDRRVLFLIMLVPLFAVIFVDFFAASRLYDQFFILFIGLIGYIFVTYRKKISMRIPLLIWCSIILLNFIFLNTVFTFTS